MALSVEVAKRVPRRSVYPAWYNSAALVDPRSNDFQNLSEISHAKRRVKSTAFRNRWGVCELWICISSLVNWIGITMKKQPAENNAISVKPAAKSDSKAKPAAGKKPNALQQPLKPSVELASVLGKGALTRGEVTSKIWEYIKAEKLQDPKDGRQILADEKLKSIFKKDKVSMFEMSGILSKHLT